MPLIFCFFQNNVIDKLNQELNDLRTQFSHHGVPDGHTHPLQGNSLQQKTALAQQLSFAEEGGEGRERLVDLATQVEDLKYQVSSLTEQLEEASTRISAAEVSTN